MVLGNLQVPKHPADFIIRHVPSAHAVGAAGGCLDINSLFFLPQSGGRGAGKFSVLRLQ